MSASSPIGARRLFRVAGFRPALLEIDRLGGGASRIELVVGDEDKLRFDGLTLISPAGSAFLEQPHVEIEAGERVLIARRAGSGQDEPVSLHRRSVALGRRPDRAAVRGWILFMPKRPYIPDGSLREILAYPGAPEAFSTQDYAVALTRMGLDYLAARLDVVSRWDRDLTSPEQQALAFARLLLHKPRWVIVDEAIGSLSAPARKAVFDIFTHELAGSALVNISGPQAADVFFTRSLRLSRNPQGESLVFPKIPVKPKVPDATAETESRR